mmetsp:Transcript_126337/g.252446  ORF Transcript_126337/g.252446 Transcript_126337/m.252446 type:complete len:184 (-) Transcript_126337:281-832(-)
MQTGARIPTALDFSAEESLQHVLRPEFHGLVGNWMRTATNVEKRGIVTLAGMAEPKLTSHIGRPRGPGHEVRIQESPWKFRRATHSPSGKTLGRSSSSPFLPQQMDAHMDDFVPPSWMREDAVEIEQIKKPGGYVVGLKDSAEIQRKKNLQRNTGTYQLFSGSFVGQTSNSEAHSLRAVGLDV